MINKKIVLSFIIILFMLFSIHNFAENSNNKKYEYKDKWEKKWKKKVWLFDELHETREDHQIIDEEYIDRIFGELYKGVEIALRKLKNTTDKNGDSLECIAERIEDFLNDARPPLGIYFLNTQDFERTLKGQTLGKEFKVANTDKDYQEPTSWLDSIFKQGPNPFKIDPKIYVQKPVFDRYKKDVCIQTGLLLHELIHVVCIDSEYGLNLMHGKNAMGEKIMKNYGER